MLYDALNTNLGVGATLVKSDTILESIGNTPIVKLNNILKQDSLNNIHNTQNAYHNPNSNHTHNTASTHSTSTNNIYNSRINLYAKLEYLNPSGSVKDRMARHIITRAEEQGLLIPGGVIVENSSGNTGASLAMIAAIKGYRCIITMPDKMSDEKRNLMQSFGARVVVTPTEVPPDSPESYYSVAKRIALETPNAYYPDQYNNPQNIEAHYLSTGPEIWEQMGGKIDMVVAGAGTGGTISGVGRFLKEKNPNIKIIAVDPLGSIFYDYFYHKKLVKPKLYKVEGIGEDYLVKCLDFDVLDDIVQVDDRQSFLMSRRLAREEGIFAGGSSGAAVYAALEYTRNIKRPQNIVVILPDSGNRYLSKFYRDEWLIQEGIRE